MGVGLTIKGKWAQVLEGISDRAGAQSCIKREKADTAAKMAFQTEKGGGTKRRNSVRYGPDIFF